MCGGTDASAGRFCRQGGFMQGAVFCLSGGSGLRFSDSAVENGAFLTVFSAGLLPRRLNSLQRDNAA